MTQQRSQVDEIVHQVNNLLATIEIQAEVARAIGTAAAHAEAMALIVASARRTRAEMTRIAGGNTAEDSLGAAGS